MGLAVAWAIATLGTSTLVKYLQAADLVDAETNKWSLASVLRRGVTTASTVGYGVQRRRAVAGRADEAEGVGRAPSFRRPVVLKGPFRSDVAGRLRTAQPGAEALELFEELRLLLELQQWAQLSIDVLPVESVVALTDDGHLDITPVLRA